MAAHHLRATNIFSQRVPHGPVIRSRDRASSLDAVRDAFELCLPWLPVVYQRLDLRTLRPLTAFKNARNPKFVRLQYLEDRNLLKLRSLE